MKNNQNILHGASNGVYFLTHYRDTPNSCIYTLKKNISKPYYNFFLSCAGPTPPYIGFRIQFPVPPWLEVWYVYVLNGT